MKTNLNRIAILAVALFAEVEYGHSQGTFQNLNFELANVPVVPAGQYGTSVAIDQALPGWTAYYNASQINEVWHNNLSLGGAAIILQGPQWRSSEILQGQFSVLLGGDYNPNNAPDFINGVAIAQTGQIPTGTEAVMFFGSPLNSLNVFFSGQQIPITQVGATPNYTIWGGDVSAFAGQTGELRFSAPFNHGGLLDNILFSSQPIPEPSTFGLFAFGALFLGWRLRRVRKP